MVLENLQPGSPILSCQPFCYVVAKKVKTWVCDSCLKSAQDPNGPKSLKKCASCKYARYCDRNCQKAGWNIHKGECKYLVANANDVPMDFVRLACRIWIKMKKGEDDVQCVLPDGETRTISDLPWIVDQDANDSRHKTLLGMVVYSLCRYMGPDAPSYKNISYLYGLINCNYVVIRDDENEFRGLGIYLEASAFGHSCQPNSAWVFGGKSLQVRYIGSKNLPGPVKISEDLNVCRTSMLWDTLSRQCEIENELYIKCKCKKCEQEPPIDDWLKQASIICTQCACAVPIPTLEYEQLAREMRCLNCRLHVPLENMELAWTLKPKLRRIVEKHFNGIFSIQVVFIGQDEWALIKDARKIIHCYDLDLFYSLLSAMDFGMKEGHVQETLNMGLQVLKACNRHFQCPSHLTALVHYKVAQLAKSLGDKKLFEDHTRKGLEVAAITHGTEHLFYQRFLSSTSKNAL